MLQLAGSTISHQSLLHFVGEAPWSDERVLAKVCCAPTFAGAVTAAIGSTLFRSHGITKPVQ
jgi:hypothetical protein